MAWLARSIANSLRFDEDEDDDPNNAADNKPQIITAQGGDQHRQFDPSSPANLERGVKEDLSELTKTLTRQFWGVASFLAPPPQSSQQSSPISDSSPDKASDSADPEASDSAGIAGIRSDFAEIGGRFRSGISKLSNNIAVSEISKIASNFLQLGSEGDANDSVGATVGVTEEVVAFVRDVATHPETWLDFPLPDDEDEDDEFDMSDVQQEHALAVERLAPRLAALRFELCPGYMTEGSFWKIYFVLLHPRLNKHDADLLSTPQIVKARALLMQELQNRTKANLEQDSFGRGTSVSNEISMSPEEKGISVPSAAEYESVLLEASVVQQSRSSGSADLETEKHDVQSVEIPIIDKSVVEEGPVNLPKDQNLHPPSSSRILEEKYEDYGDDWLKEDSAEMVSAGGHTIPIENEEDVSFSDLEEDDDDVPTTYKKVTYGSDSATKDSRDWVQLSRSSTASAKDVDAVKIDPTGSKQGSAHNSETKESNDWLDVDEIDVD